MLSTLAHHYKIFKRYLKKTIVKMDCMYGVFSVRSCLGKNRGCVSGDFVREERAQDLLADQFRVCIGLAVVFLV